MCAVPVDGLHKDDVTHEQLVKIQGLLKRRIPTGTASCLLPSIPLVLLLKPTLLQLASVLVSTHGNVPSWSDLNAKLDISTLIAAGSRPSSRS